MRSTTETTRTRLPRTLHRHHSQTPRCPARKFVQKHQCQPCERLRGRKGRVRGGSRNGAQASEAKQPQGGGWKATVGGFPMIVIRHAKSWTWPESVSPQAEWLPGGARSAQVPKVVSPCGQFCGASGPSPLAGKKPLNSPPSTAGRQPRSVAASSVGRRGQSVTKVAVLFSVGPAKPDAFGQGRPRQYGKKCDQWTKMARKRIFQPWKKHQ